VLAEMEIIMRSTFLALATAAGVIIATSAAAQPYGYTSGPGYMGYGSGYGYSPGYTYGPGYNYGPGYGYGGSGNYGYFSSTPDYNYNSAGRGGELRRPLRPRRDPHNDR
jgi:hypothetical protein